MPRQVFISYGREDARELAYRLSDDLKSKGCRVWLDKTEISPGARWPEQKAPFSRATFWLPYWLPIQGMRYPIHRRNHGC